MAPKHSSFILRGVALIILSLLAVSPFSYCSVGGAAPAPAPNSAQISIGILADGRAAVYMNNSFAPGSNQSFTLSVSTGTGPVKAVSSSGQVLASAQKTDFGTDIVFSGAEGETQSAFYLLAPLTTVAGTNVYSLDLGMSFSRQFSPVSIIVTAPSGSRIVSSSGLAENTNSSYSSVYLYTRTATGQMLPISVQVSPAPGESFQYATIIQPALSNSSMSGSQYDLSLSTPVNLPVFGLAPLYSIIILAFVILIGSFLVIKSASWARSSASGDDPDRPWSLEEPNFAPEQDSSVKVLAEEKPSSSKQIGIFSKSFSELQKSRKPAGAASDSADKAMGASAPSPAKKQPAKAEAAQQPAKAEAAQQPAMGMDSNAPKAALEEQKPVSEPEAQSLPQGAIAKPAQSPAPMPKSGKPAMTAQAKSPFSFLAGLFPQRNEPPQKQEPAKAAQKPSSKPAAKQEEQSFEKKKAEQSPDEKEIIAETRKFRSGVPVSRLKKYMLMNPKVFSSSLDMAISHGALEYIEKDGGKFVRVCRKAPSTAAKKPQSGKKAKQGKSGAGKKR